MRKGEELKTPRHASAAATRDDRLPHSRHLLIAIKILLILVISDKLEKVFFRRILYGIIGENIDRF